MGHPVSLNHTQTVELVPTAPFRFDATLHKPDHFPSSDSAWEPGVRWQTMRWRGAPLGLKFEERGTVDQPRVALSIWSQEELQPPFAASLLDEIVYRYRFDLDLSEFNRRFADDPLLGPIIARWRGLKPLNCNSLYEYLVIAIVLQNATVRRSVSMLQALFERYGTRLAYDGRELYCFWEPPAIDGASEEELRGLKVGYRAKSLKRVSAAFAQGEINEFALRAKSRVEQREALLGLYGIGPASVGYILGDVFHHLDEADEYPLDHISPWEQKIYSKLFFDRDPDDPVAVDVLLRTFDERFGGYRGLAVHYVWEDLFWRWKHEGVAWLDRLIRL